MSAVNKEADDINKEAYDITKPMTAKKDDGTNAEQQYSDGMTSRCPINFAGASHFTTIITDGYHDHDCFKSL